MEGGAGTGGRGAVRLLALARLVSVAGSQAAQLALVFTVYERTKSSAWVSAALFASVAVTGLLGPLSGWVGDRFERRRVMVVSELAAGVGWLALLAADAPWLLITLALVATAAGAPFRAASAAAIPNLVDSDDLTWANGVLAGSFNTALVVGPLAGGTLVAASGADAVFAVNAVSFFGSALLITGIRGDFTAARHDGAATGVLTGFSLVARDPTLRRLATVTALSFGAFGVTLVADVALVDHFDAGSVGYGLLTTLWGLGAVAGSWIAARTLRPDTEAAGLTWGTLAMAVSIGGIAAMPSFTSAMLVGTIGGVGSGFAFVPWFSLVQRRTDDEHRSRVFATAEVCEQGAFAVGMLVAGVVVGAVGARPTYLVPGGLLAAGALVAARVWRSHATDRIEGEAAVPLPTVAVGKGPDVEDYAGQV